MQPRKLPGAALVCLSLALVAGSAQAMLIQTPLTMTVSDANPKVGDTVTFSIDAQNESLRQQYAGQVVSVNFYSDSGGEGGNSTSGVVNASVRLDAKAHATFAWKVPAIVNNTNVFVSALQGNNTTASTRLRVGDAPPIAYALGGPAGGSGGVEQPGPVVGGTNGTAPAPTPGSSGAPNGTAGASSGKAQTPGLSVVLVAAALGIAGMVAMRSRRPE